MREPLRDRERLEHIIAAADNIARYTEGKTYDDLQTDDMMGYAVVYNILAIGETARRMKQRGYDTDEICKITGLSRDEIERL